MSSYEDRLRRLTDDELRAIAGSSPEDFRPEARAAAARELAAREERRAAGKGGEAPAASGQEPARGPAEALWRQAVGVGIAFVGVRPLAVSVLAVSEWAFGVEPPGIASLGALLGSAGVGALLVVLGRWTSRLWFRGAEAGLGLWAIGGLRAALGAATAETPSWDEALSVGLVAVAALLAAAALEVRFRSR